MTLAGQNKDNKNYTGIYKITVGEEKNGENKLCEVSTL